MENASPNRRSIVAQQFHHARRQAVIEALTARLTGHSASLLSYEEVAKSLGVRGQASAGQQEVPVAAIVGSVGRYNDFTKSFLPLQNSDEARWVSVHMAARHIGDLPPVELYRIGDSYFVLDGNHRISIARQENLEFIDAYVTEIYTRVPLPPGASPDALIIAAEYAEFLEWTRLDRRRNNVDLTVSVPGQYAHLESHIEAFRFITDLDESCELELSEASARWYDEAYLPLAEAIREQGILSYFPGRTETDFFIWLASHRAALHDELGITLTPEATVSRLLTQIQLPDVNVQQPLPSRWRRAMNHLVATKQEADRIEQSWSQVRSIARYSDQLFADILVPIELNANGLDSAAFRQAMVLAKGEGARLCVLGVANLMDAPAALGEAYEQLGQLVWEHTEPLGIEATVLVDEGDLASIVGRLSPLYDLIVFDRPAPSQAPTEVDEVLIQARRPILVASEPDEFLLAGRISVLIDDNANSRESLYIAAYLAEQHHLDMIFLVVGRGRGVAAALSYARDYVEMHEISAETVTFDSATALNEMTNIAELKACDMLIIPGLTQPAKKGDRARRLSNIINSWPHSLLIANWS